MIFPSRNYWFFPLRHIRAAWCHAHSDRTNIKKKRQCFLPWRGGGDGGGSDKRSSWKWLGGLEKGRGSYSLRAHIWVQYTLFAISPAAHDVEMTSHQRRCDVMTSHRRWYDVFWHHMPTGLICAWIAKSCKKTVGSVEAFMIALLRNLTFKLSINTFM